MWPLDGTSRMPGQQARTVFGGRGDSNVTSLLGGSKRAFRLRAGRLLHPVCLHHSHYVKLTLLRNYQLFRWHRPCTVD